MMSIRFAARRRASFPGRTIAGAALSVLLTAGVAVAQSTPGADPAAPTAPSIPATLPHDLSPWGMFLQADIVVKAVMLGLAFASLVTWTVWLAKRLELVRAKRSARKALRGAGFLKVALVGLEDAQGAEPPAR